MSSDQEPRAVAQDRPPGARPWLRNLVLAVALIAVAAWGFYSAFPLPPGEPERTDAAKPAVAARAPDADPPARVPLDPIMPETGADLIAEVGRVAGDLARRFPQNPDAHEMLARYQLEYADIAVAEATWQRCLELNANYAYAHIGLAKIATQRGEFDAATAHWRRAILADPQMYLHQIELGKSLLAAGEIDEAIEVLAGAVRAAPASARGHAELGAAYLQKRDDAAAKTSFEAALRLDPKYATAHFGLATACTRLGLAELAQAHEAKYVEYRSERGDELRGQRLAYDDEAALAEDFALLYSDIGKVFLAEGQPALAEQLWRRAASMHAENLACRQALAWLLMQQNKPLETIRMLRELARLEPESAAYPLEISRLYRQLGRGEDARRALEAFADSSPDSAAGQRALAEFYLQFQNAPQSAVEHARRAAELSESTQDWVLLGSAHELAGDLTAATVALERAAAIAPDDLQIRQMLALLREARATEPSEPDKPATSNNNSDNRE
ncbi:MAG: tetratricopeptide repeat protein [Pirellulaceae bacterium]